jgi:hypothetical protein
MRRATLFKIKRFGNWGKVLPKFSVTAGIIVSGLRKEADKTADQYLTEVRKAIISQTFPQPLEPLKVSTQRRKGNDLLWIDRGLFVVGLGKIELTRGSFTVKVMAGALDGVPYERGNTMFDIANWMEYGTKGMPARPVFEPVLKQVLELTDGRIKKLQNGLVKLWSV